MRKQRKKNLNLLLQLIPYQLEDLYGGEICTLDRQHPRDLFDIKLLMENEGLTVGIVKAFVFYLISHDEPIVEVLNPGLQDITKMTETEFAGMSSEGD
ncbi:MAG: nucleotidyl transferase AbiEii/AbiGii toxin family protein [Ignavibacteriales bacterium]|nr:nucleotidyl transferase AbiEii/AbiGii toxin family protein [Ignavibacteriales bacterium]